MEIAYFCVLINCCLPVIWAGLAKMIAGFRIKDNNSPREFLGRQSGASKRALWAQKNAWEALCPFASAVIIAAICEVPVDNVVWAAVIYTVCRIIYGFVYIMDYATLRSLIWSIAVLLNIYIFVIAIF